MLVKNWMSKNVITVGINDSISDAIKILIKQKIRILPVMDREKLVGIITDRDLKRASASDATSLDVHELHFLLNKIKVKDVMSENPMTVPLDFTVEETSEILLKNKISGVPVVNANGSIVGIITQSDLFRVMISLTGADMRGVQFAFRVKDEPGSIKNITDVMRKYGGRMACILSSYDGVPEGYRKVYIRVYGIESPKLSMLKEELSKKASLIYMINHIEIKREIYENT